MSETYSIPNPPQGVTRVRCTDDSGMSFAVITDGLNAGLWRGSNGGVYEWHQLLATWGEVEPVPLTDREAAVVYFRAENVPTDLRNVDSDDWFHASVLIEDALSRG